MKRLIIIYNLIIISAIVILGITSAQNIVQLIIALLFSPLVIYFWILLFPRKSSLTIKAITNNDDSELVKNIESEEGEVMQTDVDSTRRAFLKIIGSAGVSMFAYFLFTQKAEAAFFGSVPGSGTVAIKDSTGTKIDPAEKHPTDGYKVSELDDTSSPSFYGFTNKTGDWFIMKEDSNGAYRYIKGVSDFSTNWTNRASLSYDYYHNVF